MKMKILVVDDDYSLRELISLLYSDHTVVQASTGEEALELIMQQGFDLVLTDYDMRSAGGKMTGVDLLERINERIDHPRPDLWLWSGTLTDQIVKKAEVLGADVIQKPVPVTELMARLARLTTNAKLDVAPV